MVQELKNITVKEIEQAIGIPADDWKGNCHAIACEVVKAGLVEGEAVYGHWRGPVAKTSMFYRENSGLGICRHGWVETADGFILDPTRWVFEDTEPYIFIGDPEYDEMACGICGHLRDEHGNDFMAGCQVDGCNCDCFDPSGGIDRSSVDYDRGGNVFRKSMERPAPEYNLEKRGAFEFSGGAKRFIEGLIGDSKGVCFDRLFWLANLSTETLGPYIDEIYQVIKDSGNMSLIPVDNYQMIFGDD